MTALESSLPPWDLELRRCQREAVSAWMNDRPVDSLVVITPGGGKTLLCARLAHALLSAQVVPRVVAVVPTDHLRAQVAGAFAKRGVLLAPFQNGDVFLPSYAHGAVVTYQQVAADPEAIRRVARGAFMWLDELHHAGAHATWGDALRRAFGESTYRLGTTGTPRRTDDGMLPFVQYDRGQARSIYTYTYRDGLLDGILRPVLFEVMGAEVRWLRATGQEVSARTDDLTAKTYTIEERLNAVVRSPDWFRGTFAAADRRLQEFRQTDPTAGGLIVGVDMAHARKLAREVTAATGMEPVLSLSDDPQSSERISTFASSRRPWIVAVRQVSEGVDIPRLRVGVWATTTASRLFFDQFTGRFLRRRDGVGAEQIAAIYIPQHEVLVEHARRYAEDVDAYGKYLRPKRPSLLPPSPAGEAAPPVTVLSGAAYYADQIDPVGHPASLGLASEPRSEPVTPAPARAAVEARGASPTAPREDGGDLINRMRERRREVTIGVARLAKTSGLAHGKIHAALNRLCGGRAIDRATLAQLDLRVRELGRWLERGRIG